MLSALGQLGRAGVPSRRGRPGGRALAGVALAGVLAVATSMPAAAAPADSVRDQQQWVLGMLSVPSAWSVSEGANVTVAVIDSGVNPDVSDLSGAVIDRKQLHRPEHLEQQPALGAARDLDGVDHRRPR